MKPASGLQLLLGHSSAHLPAGGLDVTTRVVRRSEQRMEDNRLDTSEYFRYIALQH